MKIDHIGLASKAPEAISSSYAERELIGRSQSEFYEGNPPQQDQ